MVDDALRSRIRQELQTLDNLGEKSIVGGIGFTWRGNLLCGVLGEDLVVRVDRGEFEAFVGEDGAGPMTMGGRASKGWIVVPGAQVSAAAGLRKWLDRAIGYVGSLAPKT